MAQVCGPFDRNLCYGITTTFYDRDAPDYSGLEIFLHFIQKCVFFLEFCKLMDKEFKIVKNLLEEGRDVIIPKPSLEEMNLDFNKYFDERGLFLEYFSWV